MFIDQDERKDWRSVLFPLQLLIDLNLLLLVDATIDLTTSPWMRHT
jgi:hypothetical protein